MERFCQQCGGPIPPARKPSEYAKRKFCSHKCCGEHQQNDISAIVGRIRVNPETGCHIWTGQKIWSGYGVVNYQSRTILLHRLMWERARGPVPEGLQLDHLCGVKSCCNPEHLRAVTARENSLAPTSNNMAARNFRRLACPRCGGPYSQFPNGRRYCKPCRNQKLLEAQRVRRAKKKLGIPLNRPGCYERDEEYRRLYIGPSNGEHFNA